MKQNKGLRRLALCLSLLLLMSAGVCSRAAAVELEIIIEGPENNRTIPVTEYIPADEAEDSQYIQLGKENSPIREEEMVLGQLYQIRSNDFYYTGEYVLDEEDYESIIAYYYCVPLNLPEDPSRALLVISQKNYCAEIIANQDRPVRSFQGVAISGNRFSSDVENTMNYTYDSDYENQPEHAYGYGGSVLLAEKIDGEYLFGSPSQEASPAKAAAETEPATAAIEPRASIPSAPPKTGESSTALLWAPLCVAALCAAMLILRKRTKAIL